MSAQYCQIINFSIICRHIMPSDTHCSVTIKGRHSDLYCKQQCVYTYAGCLGDLFPIVIQHMWNRIWDSEKHLFYFMKPSHLRIQWWVNSKGGKNLEPHQGVKPWHTVPLHSWSSYCHSKILNLLNPETEHTQLVNILCDKLGNTHKAFLWHTEVWWAKKKHLNNYLSYKLSHLHRTGFLFQRTDKLIIQTHSK